MLAVEDHVEELKRSRSALKAEAAVCTQGLQAAIRKERQATKRAEKAWQLSASEKDVVLIIYVISDYVVAPAISFLERVGNKRHWPCRSRDDLQALTEDMFLAADPATVVSLCDRWQPLKPESMQVARRYVEEFGVVEWVGNANRQLGAAPSADALLQEMERRRVMFPAAARFPPLGNAKEIKGRVWAFRWRKRYGARIGRLRFREDISVEELRQKVRFYYFLVTDTAPESETGLRSLLWNLFWTTIARLYCQCARGRVSVPLSGPCS